MAKKHKHPEHENHERWLVSYADFITLLFATFTALYAIATADLASMKDVATAIQQGFQEQSIVSGIKSILQGQSPPNDNPNPLSKKQGEGSGLLGQHDSMTYMPGEVKKVDKAVEQLKNDFEQINKGIRAARKPKQKDKGKAKDTAQKPVDIREMTLSLEERGIKVSVDSSLFFESGSSVLRPEAKEILAQVAERLRPFAGTNLIQVEGHTDNIPIATAQFPSNWELSTARASSVVRFFTESMAFDSRYLAAAGYADTRPVALNTTPEGRSKNRRIDIIIYSKMVGNKLDPRMQRRTENPVVDEAADTLNQEGHAEENAAAAGHRQDGSQTLPTMPTTTRPTKKTEHLEKSSEEDAHGAQSHVLQSEDRDEHGKLILPEEDARPIQGGDGPVHVIIEDRKTGKQRVLPPVKKSKD